MKIVIVGNGKIGSTLAQRLSKENHDVVIIDYNPTVLEESQTLLDVMIVQGNGASYEVQREAEVQNSDLLIAVTSTDELNLLACMLAKKLGCKHTIARVRNTEYESQIRFLKEEFGLSMVVNPERSAAREIYKILQFPSFLKRDSFAGGKVELVEVKIGENSPLAGMYLENISSLTKIKMLVCAVDRQGEVIIPSGGFQILPGDKITIAAAAHDLVQIIKVLNITTQKTKGVIIIGGSRIAVYLAKILIRSHISVKIIDQDRDRCELLSTLLPEALIIHGNGASQQLLLEEGIKNTDAVITLTGIDEENLILSMYADSIGVTKTITKVNSTEYSEIFKDRGVGSIISAKMVTANEITRYVRAMSNRTGGSVLTLHRIMGNKAEALEFKVVETTKGIGKPLSQLKLKKGILIASIYRHGNTIIPKGADTLELGDTLIIITTTDQPIIDLNNIFLEGANE